MSTPTAARSIEDRIAALAASQRGVVTRRQLLDAGLSSKMIDRRQRSGRFRPLHRGIYLLGPLLPPLARETAAVLASGSHGVISHFSALAVWGLTPAARSVAATSVAATSVAATSVAGTSVAGTSVAGTSLPSPTSRPRATASAREPSPVSAHRRAVIAPALRDEEPVHITVEGTVRGARPGIRVHRVVRLPPEERTTQHGLPITTPARTLADVASMVGLRELEAAMARAEREGLVTREAMCPLAARRRHRPGARMLRAVLELRGGPALTRSEAEARFLALVRDAGLPAPATNVPVGRYEIDFLWKDAGIAVEVDGFRHHASRPRFEGDRRKDAWLLAAGIKVIRLSWHQIVDESVRTAVQVGQALVRGGRPG